MADKFSKFKVKEDKFSKFKSKVEDIDSEELLKDKILDKVYTVDKAIGDYAFRNIPSRIQAMTDPRRAKVKEEISLQERGLPQTSVRQPDESSFFGLLNKPGAKAPSREDFPTTGYEGATFGELQAELAKIKGESLSDEEYYKAKNPALYHGSGIATGAALDIALTGGAKAALGTGTKVASKMPKILEGLSKRLPKVTDSAVSIAKSLKRPAISSATLGVENALRGEDELGRSLVNGFFGDMVLQSSGKVADIGFKKMAPALTGIRKEFIDMAAKDRNFKDRVPFIKKASKLFNHIKSFGKSATEISGEIQKELHSAPKAKYRTLIKEFEDVKKQYTDFKGSSKGIDKMVQDFYDDVAYNVKGGKINLNHLKTRVQELDKKLQKSYSKGDYVEMPDKIMQGFRDVINKKYLAHIDGYTEAMAKASDNMNIYSEFMNEFKTPQQLYSAIKKKNRMITSGNFQMGDTKLQVLDDFDSKIFGGDIRRTIDKDIAQEAIFAPNRTWAEDIRESGYTSILAGMAGDAVGLPGRMIGSGVLGVGVARKRLGKKAVRAWISLRDKIANNPNSVPQGARNFLGEFSDGAWANAPKSLAKHMYLFNKNKSYRDLFENDEEDVDENVERSVRGE